MTYLLLDSSNVKLAVGLSVNNQIVDSIYYDARQRQSEFMIQEIDNILNRNNLSMKDIDGIIATEGPGSFTGIRISLTIAKTYSVSLNRPVYLLSSLQILKKNDDLSLCVMNARSNRSYVGIYKGNEAVLKDCIMPNDEVINLIKKNEYVLCGDSKYLGFDGYNTNIFEEMISILPSIEHQKEPLKIKAVYLKD